MPFIDSIPSSRGLQKKVIPITFPSGWDGLKGPLFDWYRGLSCQHINRLQIRKDSSGAVPHRFIVAHLTDQSIQRFDRRPKSKNPGEIVAAGLLKTSTIEAVDEIEMVELSAWPGLEEHTKCEVDLYLAGEINVLAILSACYGISCDDYAHNYALLQYNCYFFSWTILAIVARHKIPNSIPQADRVFDRLEPGLSSLTATLAGKLSKVAMNVAIDTAAAFNREIGWMTMMRGSGWADKIIWSMPISILRFVMRNMMAFRLHPKPHIQNRLFSGLAPKLRLMLESKLHAHLIPAKIHNSLWLSEVQQLVESTIRAEITNTLWDVMWDTTGGADSDIDIFEIAREAFQARIAEGRPGKAAQFSALWNAVHYSALLAVRRSAHGKITNETTTRETIFDGAWYAARDAALTAAQAVIRDTKAQLNNPKQDIIWEKMWEVWNQAWGTAHGMARESVLVSVNNMANGLVSSVVEAIVLELGGSHLKLAPVRVNVDNKTSVRSSNVEMTHGELQDFIQKLIRASSMEQDSLSIAAAMGRVWKASRLALTKVEE